MVARREDASNSVKLLLFVFAVVILADFIGDLLHWIKP